MPDNIPEDVKIERLNRMIALQNELSLESNRRDIGKEIEGWVEGNPKPPPEELFGRTSHKKGGGSPPPGGRPAVSSVAAPTPPPPPPPPPAQPSKFYIIYRHSPPRVTPSRGDILPLSPSLNSENTGKETTKN